jgi:hypothetical protein
MRTDERVVGFIKAMTAYGGDSYAEYEPFWNDQNAALFQAWMTFACALFRLTRWQAATCKLRLRRFKETESSSQTWLL